MRVIPVLVLSLALLLPGCFGGDEEPPADDGTTPTPTPTGSTTPTPTTTPTPPTKNNTGNGGNGTGGNTTKPPMDVHTGNKDYASNTPTPPATEGVSTEKFTVAAGYKKLAVNGTWTLGSGAPVVIGTATSMKITDPAGTDIGKCDGPAAGAATGGPCTFEATTAPAGEYTVTYTGTANVVLAFTVEAS